MGMTEEIEDCEKGEGIKLIKKLGIKPVCKYCGNQITEDNFGGVFKNPSRASCNRLTCLWNTVYDTNEKMLDGIITGGKKDVIINEEEIEKIKCPSCGKEHKRGGRPGWWLYTDGEWTCDCGSQGTVWYSGNKISFLQKEEKKVIRKE